MFEKRWLHWCFSIYNLLIRVGSNLQSIFLFYMRLTWGYQFLLAGLKKVHHIEETTFFFTSLTIPYPMHHAYLVSYIEIIGGICFMVGFASRLSAVPLSIIMIAALGTAHAPNINDFRFVTEPMALAAESPYPFLITSLLLFTFGPGRLSIDAWLKRWVHKQDQY